MTNILVIGIAIGSLICWIKVLIVLFSKAGVGLGILGIICPLFPFIWGWVKHKEYGLTKVMIVWTALFVASFVVNGLNAAAILKDIQSGKLQPAPAQP